MEMKKTVKFFIKQVSLIVFGVSVFLQIPVALSQNVQEFAPVGAEWYYDNFIYQTQTVFYRKYTYLKDTTINAISCGIIERYRKDGLNSDTLIQQYIHVLDNKIYEYENDTLFLLYDFNKNSEEYWIMPKYNDTIYVKNKYKIALLNGDSCTCFVVENTNMHWKHSLITDCFGDINGLFPAPNTVGYGYGELRCYLENDELLYANGSYACNYSNVSISEALDNQNKILFSNPVYDKVAIIFNSSLDVTTLHIAIYNTLGQRINSQIQINDNEILIDLSKEKSGVYIVTIQDKNKIIQNCKLIKL